MFCDKLLLVAPLSKNHGEGRVCCLVFEMLRKELGACVDVVNTNTVGEPPTLKLISYTKSVISICVQRFRQPKLVYVSPSRSSSGMFRELLMLLIFRRETRYILHVHGATLKRVYESTVIGKIVWQLYSSRVAVLIGLSAGHKKFLPGLPRATFEILPNPVDFKSLDESSGTTVATGAARFGFLSNPDEKKGLQEAIRALQTNGAVGTFFVGGWEVDDFRRVYGFEPPGWVKFVGPIGDAEKEEFFSLFDVFLYPSKNDAQPIVVLEALAFNRLVALSDTMFLSDLFVYKNCYSLVEFWKVFHSNGELPIQVDSRFKMIHDIKFFENRLIGIVSSIGEGRISG